MERHRVVSQEEWLAARQKLLAEEKEFTRRRDELSRLRRELPWQRVDKPHSSRQWGDSPTYHRTIDHRRTGPHPSFFLAPSSCYRKHHPSHRCLRRLPRAETGTRNFPGNPAWPDGAFSN